LRHYKGRSRNSEPGNRYRRRAASDRTIYRVRWLLCAQSSGDYQTTRATTPKTRV